MSVKEENVRIARQSIEAFNAGDISKVEEVIGSEYYNHESQADPRSAKLRGPDEFIDTVKSLRNAFIMRSTRLIQPFTQRKRPIERGNYRGCSENIEHTNYRK